MNNKIVKLGLLMVAATLGGCGLKGPLYFPDANSQVTPAKETSNAEKNNQNTTKASSDASSTQTSEATTK